MLKYKMKFYKCKRFLISINKAGKTEEYMLKTYRTVEQLGQDEVVIEKSTFIGYA